ncbi:MAG: hypothetical protein WBA41_03240 [Rivularia sp. (in: cyanobacteria)]
MHLSYLFNLPQTWLLQIYFFIAQATPTPTSTSTPQQPSPTTAVDIEYLKQQIQFLQDSHTRLNNSFTVFLTAIGLIATIVGIVSTFFFKQSLKEAQQMVKSEVETRLQSSVSTIVGKQVDNLKQILDREEILGNISVDYILPEDEVLTVDDYPAEYLLLAQRGFKDTRILDASKKIKITSDIVVLDLVNYQLVSDAEKNGKQEDEIDSLIQTRAAEQIDKIVKVLPKKTIIIVYTRPGKLRITAVDDLPKKPNVKYYASANTPVNLMGTVVDSAYVADARKKI